jgi:hypothetical protein
MPEAASLACLATPSPGRLAGFYAAVVTRSGVTSARSLADWNRGSAGPWNRGPVGNLRKCNRGKTRGGFVQEG